LRPDPRAHAVERLVWAETAHIARTGLHWLIQRRVRHPARATRNGLRQRHIAFEQGRHDILERLLFDTVTIPIQEECAFVGVHEAGIVCHAIDALVAGVVARLAQ